jgi:hypothetical protein
MGPVVLEITIELQLYIQTPTKENTSKRLNDKLEKRYWPDSDLTTVTCIWKTLTAQWTCDKTHRRQWQEE